MEKVRIDDSKAFYLNEISKYPVLTPEQEQKMATAAKTNIEVRNKFIECNLRLVASIAGYFDNSAKVDFLDLVQEGSFGLIKAIENFDPDRGYKFSTYATWWIRQSIIRGLQTQGRTIKVPPYISEDFTKISNAEKTLEIKYGREVRPEEIAKYLGIDEEKIYRIYDSFRDASSLDVAVGDNMTKADVVEDESIEAMDEMVKVSMVKDRLNEVLNELSDREREVICMRFGLLDDVQYTFSQIGKKIGLSGERARQICNNSMKKICEMV